MSWALAVGLAIVALLHLVAWDSVEPLMVANALEQWLYLPAWAVATGALLTRRWWLGVLSLAVVGAQLAFVLPELLAASPLPAWTRGAPAIRVFDANVDKQSTFAQGYVRAIEADRPDLVALEEIDPPALSALVGSGALRRLRYRCADPQFGAGGLALASRWPLEGCRISSVLVNRFRPRSPYLISAVLRAPAGPVAVRVVHPLAPVPAFWHQWSSAMAAIDADVASSGTRRMLMVGDFNATWGNRAFRTLLGDGLTDAAAARGQALDMTWPVGAIMPPFVRIDHLLTGSNLAVTAIVDRPGFRSDHRYLTATVAVRPAS
ncbi:MAG: endonuclease/exonuclease/phosphatase family protein [Acidimicrobiales bacterium]